MSASKWLDFGRRWLVFIAFLVVWQLVTKAADDPYFPPPTDILSAAKDAFFGNTALTDDILPSLGRIFAGWGISVVVGVPLGLALGRSPVVTDYVSPMFFFARSIPAALLVPVFLVAFGIGPKMEIITILWGTIWPILLNTIDGARSVDDVKTETVRAFRISRADWIFGVVLPTALPKVFAGMRLGLSLAIILMVVSELMGGSTSGIGYQMILTQSNFVLSQMWAWIVLVSLLGYLANLLLSVAEKRALAWHPGFRSEAAM
ncbi:ABC transporter permease [Amycolatopsis sp.]|uniref:ABC transporter permease n=1 Tax=Amycolatopsis sp. TaxID=37632 RepID=UPI002C7AB75A|nr:ABC transporter permease [Amycolatopsis sp.]HVV11541.1 ABC transporter permease [Amycolatopsis sp.]